MIEKVKDPVLQKELTKKIKLIKINVETNYDALEKAGQELDQKGLDQAIALIKNMKESPLKTELSSKIENIQKNITQLETINQIKDSVNKALASKSLKEIEEAKILVSKMDDSDLKKELSEQLNKAEAALKETEKNTNVNTNTNTNTNTKPESNTKPVDTSNKVDAVLPNVGISNNFVLYATLSILIGAMTILVDKKRTVK